MPGLKVKFVYEHGTADDNRLDLYDGAKSLEGIARTLTITTHALLNGEIRTRADAANGAEFYIQAPRSGSFIYEATIFFGGAITSGVFYDFLKYTLNEAIGRLEDAPLRPALQDRIEPTIGELPAVLENALLDVHRPLMQAPEMLLKITRPRGEVLAVFDRETGLNLRPHNETLDDPVLGNVTRYNTLSRWGKLYDRSEGRVISFHLSEDLTVHERSLITWSLHESNLKRDHWLYFKVVALKTASQNRTKRYFITRVSQTPLADV
ncbi:MAG: hypothetical protein EPN72_01140 [Nevskiaceae bacterium]|nr:MAG: hypothetical protein EPN63_11890 [Nevskiaceae bacterium]TBR74661.1 MAG: hypothetical protein EPN72_01140 [Nevskiaceae bacterium]